MKDSAGPAAAPPGSAADPQAEWMAAMGRGDFAAAWTISDAVLRRRVAAGPCWHLPRHEQYVWRGDALAGRRVLVRCYHGLGDTVQFVRFTAPLRRIAREVIVWAQPELVDLVSTAAGVDRVLPLHDGTPDVACDTDIEVMELPHALRVMAEDLPGPIPYLRAPAATGAICAAGDLRVGLVWQAGGWDARRSVPAVLLAPLARIGGVRLHSLQIGPGRRDAGCIPVDDIATEDITALAARMMELDLILSVDTLAAHLAGALGRPCWTLLHAGCDWRWGTAGTSTPWYPTMRLFRQRQAGGWQRTIGEVGAALHEAALHRR